MRKLVFSAMALALAMTSCKQNEDVSNQANEIKTTDVVVALSSNGSQGALAGAVETQRPGSVLDWIDTIDLKAETTIQSGNQNYYSTSETYVMTDDGSGAANFVLNQVALGSNDFHAYGKSYNQVGERVFGGVRSNDPQAVLASLRNKVPNANFSDSVMNQLVVEGAANAVNFDMKAESGRLMLVFAITDDVQNTLDTQNIYISGSVLDADGNTIDSFWNYWGMYGRQDNVMTFYWSENDWSQTGASVHFSIDVVDGSSSVFPVTNSFERTYTITNGVSVGCVYTIGADYVSEDLNDFNFTFDWTETDCDDCIDDEIGIEVDSDLNPEVANGELCEIPNGVLSLRERDYNGGRTIEVVNGSHVVELANGTGTNSVFVIGGVEYLVSAKSRYYLALDSETTYSWQILNATNPQRPVVASSDLTTGLNDCQ